MEITISLSDNLLKAVDEAAQRMGISQDELCRRAIARFVEQPNADSVLSVLDAVYGAASASALDPLIEAAGNRTLVDENW